MALTEQGAGGSSWGAVEAGTTGGKNWHIEKIFWEVGPSGGQSNQQKFTDLKIFQKKSENLRPAVFVRKVRKII